MITYLDASVLVPLLLQDAFTPRARGFVIAEQPIPVLSDIAAAEFVSVVARRLRTKMLTEAEARDALSSLDLWAAGEMSGVECRSSDIAIATASMRRLDLPLRTVDAIHIAIVQRARAMLATFDVQMATNARALGVPVATI